MKCLFISVSCINCKGYKHPWSKIQKRKVVWKILNIIRNSVDIFVYFLKFFKILLRFDIKKNWYWTVCLEIVYYFTIKKLCYTMILVLSSELLCYAYLDWVIFVFGKKIWNSFFPLNFSITPFITYFLYTFIVLQWQGYCAWTKSFSSQLFCQLKKFIL